MAEKTAPKEKRYRVIREFRSNAMKHNFKKGEIGIFPDEYVKEMNLLDEVDKDGKAKPKEQRRPKIEAYSVPVAKEPEPSGDE